MTYSQLYTQIIKPFFIEKGAGDFMPFYTQDWDKFLFETINTAKGKPFIGYCFHKGTQAGLYPNNRLMTFEKHSLIIDVLFPLGVKNHEARLANWDNGERLLMDFINYIYGIDKITQDSKSIDVKIDGLPSIEVFAEVLESGKSENGARKDDCSGARLAIDIQFLGNLPCNTPIFFDLERVKQVMAKTSTASNSKTNENALNRFRK